MEFQDPSPHIITISVEVQALRWIAGAIAVFAFLILLLGIWSSITI